MRKSSYSPLRYLGGKTKAIKFLKEYVPEDTKEVCSPFFGGGSFEIFLSQKGIKVYGYDTFYPLVCFWKSLIYNKIELVHEIEKYYPISKEKFYELRDNIFKIKDAVELGAVLYVLNRSSFGGSILNGGFSSKTLRFTESSIDRIRFSNINVSVECLSFEESIPKHNCLVYADPPYSIPQKLYGERGNKNEDFNHKLLSDILNSRGNFILTYNNCDEIKDLYHGHKFIYPEWIYGSVNGKKSKEIMIISNDL